MAATKKATKKVASKKATKKVVTKKAATANTNIVADAYRTLAAASGWQVGQVVYINTDFVGSTYVPVGTALKEIPYLEGDYLFKGFNADGDAVVQPSYNKQAKLEVVPHYFLQTSEDDEGVKTITLNNNHEADVMRGGNIVKVGCQDIQADRVLELAEAIKAERGAVTKAAVAGNVVFKPTYVPPKAAKKAPAKKAVTK
jgi:hypothetical protein